MQRTRELALDPITQYCEIRVAQLTNPPEFEIHRSSGFWERPQHIHMIDQVNPGYFKAKREGGLLPVSPMRKTSYRYSIIPAACNGQLNHVDLPWSRSYNFVGLASGFEDRLAVIPQPEYPDVDPDITLQAALASAQTDAWDTATFMAELGKTVEMFTSFRGRVMQHYTKVLELGDRIHSSRNTGKLLFAYADAFAEAWLTLRYGLRPLYYDAIAIQRAVHQLSEGVTNPLARGWSTGNLATNRSRITNGVDLNWSIPVGAGFGDGATVMQWSAYKEISEQSRATVGVRVSTRVATMFDMAVTSWEMMPWSFILDWFITVGDAIAAFSPFATGTQEYNTHTLTTTMTEVYSFKPSITPFGDWKGGTEGSVGTITKITEIRNRTVDREIKPTLAFNLNIDALKVLDLLTIVYTLKSGILKRLAFRR